MIIQKDPPTDPIFGNKNAPEFFEYCGGWILCGRDCYSHVRFPLSPAPLPPASSGQLDSTHAESTPTSPTDANSPTTLSPGGRGLGATGEKPTLPVAPSLGGLHINLGLGLVATAPLNSQHINIVQLTPTQLTPARHEAPTQPVTPSLAPAQHVNQSLQAQKTSRSPD